MFIICLLILFIRFISHIFFIYYFLGIADISVVEELLVMKLVEKGQRVYQTKIDELEMIRNRTKNREGISLKSKNKKEKKTSVDKVMENILQVTVEEHSGAAPFLSTNRIPMRTDNSSDDITPSTASSAASDGDRRVSHCEENTPLIEKKNRDDPSEDEAFIISTKAISQSDSSQSSGMRGQTISNPNFFGSPPAPPLADSPNLNTDGSEVESQEQEQGQGERCLPQIIGSPPSSSSNPTNISVQPSIQPPHALSPPRATTSSLPLMISSESSRNRFSTSLTIQQQQEEEEEEGEEEGEDREEEETEEEENEREEMEERDQFEESQAMCMEALLGKGE